MLGFPSQTMRLLNIIYWLRCFRFDLGSEYAKNVSWSKASSPASNTPIL